MNPNLIMDRFLPEIIDSLITSKTIEIFVAMPFTENAVYRSKFVFEDVIVRSVDMANKKLEEQGKISRRFSRPKRVDEITKTATEISEDIVKGILSSHVLVADLTTGNHGALIELGMGLMVRDSKTVILLNGGMEKPHFDIADNRYLIYGPQAELGVVVDALVEAASASENERNQLTLGFKSRLSPQAIILVGLLAQIRLELNTGATIDAVTDFTKKSGGFPSKSENPRLLFEFGVQELIAHKLVRLDYDAIDEPEGVDKFAFHLTRLGTHVAKVVWPRKFSKLDLP
jgi:hypothetical protein